MQRFRKTLKAIVTKLPEQIDCGSEFIAVIFCTDWAKKSTSVVYKYN